MQCDARCLSSLASAVCLLLASEEDGSAAALPRVYGQTTVVGAATSLLRARRRALIREFHCHGEDGLSSADSNDGSSSSTDSSSSSSSRPSSSTSSSGTDVDSSSSWPLPPPLRGKAVENGKSAMSFLVPGGTDPNNSSTYSIIFKQLNKAEAALLPSLFPALQQQYSRPGGSLLTPILGWLRYTPPPVPTRSKGGPGRGHDASPRPQVQEEQQAQAQQRPFELMLMENVARPPPGTGAQSAAWWKPFDVKGIRLYAHERRYEAAFGAGGLRIGGARHEAMRAALTADVAMLREWALVDLFLISVFPLPGARPSRAALGRRSVTIRGGAGGGAAERRRGTLLAAMFSSQTRRVGRVARTRSKPPRRRACRSRARPPGGPFASPSSRSSASSTICASSGWAKPSSTSKSRSGAISSRESATTRWFRSASLASASAPSFPARSSHQSPRRSAPPPLPPPRASRGASWRCSAPHVAR